MSCSINLGKKIISQNTRPYIIAEIGVNHEGSLDRAKELINQAKEGGADAAKFQSYKAETLASKNSPAYWDTTKELTLSQYALFKKYDNFSADDYYSLYEHCAKVEIDFVSTPFDDAAIEFLNPLVPFYKIASADITNIPFLRKIAKMGKPIVISTGASTMSEIDLAIEVLENSGCVDIALLHCILNYPTENSNANLRMIEGLRHSYPGRIVGYSDHTLPNDEMTSLLVAYLLGARIIEKHFTFDKNLPGNDHYHAMDKNDLINFVRHLDEVDLVLGKSRLKAPIDSESVARKNARRSIVLSCDVSPEHVLTENDLTYKRPGTGISPLFWDSVVGRKTSRLLRADHILQWQDLIQTDF